MSDPRERIGRVIEEIRNRHVRDDTDGECINCFGVAWPCSREILARCAEALLKKHRYIHPRGDDAGCEGCGRRGPCPVLSEVVRGGK